MSGTLDTDHDPVPEPKGGGQTSFLPAKSDFVQY